MLVGVDRGRKEGEREIYGEGQLTGRRREREHT